MLSCSTALLTPLACAIEQPLATMPPDFTSWVALGALAVMCTAVAYLLYFAILKSAGATCLGLVTYLIPIVSTGLGCVLLGEALGFREVAAMLVVFAGLAMIDPSVLRGIGSWLKQPGGSARTISRTTRKHTGTPCERCLKRENCLKSCG